jgi:hypothetical protein
MIRIFSGKRHRRGGRNFMTSIKPFFSKLKLFNFFIKLTVAFVIILNNSAVFANYTDKSLSHNNIRQTGNPITICTDTNFWYPFIFIRNHKVIGLQIDIINKALRNLGFDPQFEPTSWQNCLELAKEGKVDAVATVSYRDERAAYLHYPPGAAVDRKSPWRVTEVEYVVITPLKNEKGLENHYIFNGDVKTIPGPVRVTEHYSVVADLKKEGLTVKEGKNALANFKSLVKEQTGSVVDLIEVAQHFANQSEFSNQYIVQKRPLNLKSYYLAFSRKNTIKQEDIQRIWKEIATVRDNQDLMAEFLKKY